MRVRTITGALTLCALLALVLPAAGDRRAGDIVEARIAAMLAGQAALDVLGEMSGGRRRFDRRQAQAARRDLIALARAMPGLFRGSGRTPVPEPGSRALPAVWTRADGFRSLVRAAEQAARDLDPRSLNRMRAGLPAVLAACHGCHRRYRRPK